MISVVIPAHNEEEYIGQCLDSLVSQKTSHAFEVIVVDNNSTDETAKRARAYAKKLRLQVVNELQKGRGAARNRGFAKAHGDVLLSTDADTIVPRNWIEKMARELFLHEAVTGTSVLQDGIAFTNAFYRIGQPLSMRIYRLFFGHYWLSGFNFGIRREVYKQAGGFDRMLNGQEDIDLSFRVAKIAPIHLIPDMPVICSGRRFKEGIFKGTWQYVSTFMRYYVFRNRDIILTDVR